MENLEIPLSVPGVTPVRDMFNQIWEFHAQEHPSSRMQAGAHLEIPPDSRVLLRTRREGDRFAPLGMGGHTQKIGKWMIDHKIPRGLRDAIPLLEINGEIAAMLWGSQWAVSEHFAVRQVENRILYLWFETPN
jgi:tRNA(Ile)-lysidine synthetase-like protein